MSLASAPTRPTMADHHRSAITKMAEARRRSAGEKAHPATGEPNYTTAEEEFLRACSERRKKTGRSFLTNTECFRLMLDLGYQRG